MSIVGLRWSTFKCVCCSLRQWRQTHQSPSRSIGLNATPAPDNQKTLVCVFFLPCHSYDCFPVQNNQMSAEILLVFIEQISGPPHLWICMDFAKAHKFLAMISEKITFEIQNHKLICHSPLLDMATPCNYTITKLQT